MEDLDAIHNAWLEREAETDMSLAWLRDETEAVLQMPWWKPRASRRRLAEALRITKPNDPRSPHRRVPVSPPKED